MKKIKTTLLSCCLFLLWTIQLQAQRNTVASGGNASGSGGTVSYSIGQIDYINATGTSGTVTQGNQQPYEIFVITGIEETAITLDAVVFPNPTSDYLILKVESSKLQNLSYQLYDIAGKLLANETVTNTETPVSLSIYTNAVYYMRILNNNNVIKTIKIIKN